MVIYKFIQVHFTPVQTTEIAATLLFLYSYTFYGATHNEDIGIQETLYPIILISVILLTIINPLPILLRSSRYWMLGLIGRVIVSGLHVVHFNEFFLCDLFSSLTYSFISLGTVACFTFKYPNGGNEF